MQHTGGRFVYSASDLNDFLECEHLVELERLVALGELVRPPRSASAELIAGKGLQHEHAYFERLSASGAQIATISVPGNTAAAYEEAAAQTREAMERGARIIYQGVFYDGTWLGKSDFLLRVEAPSANYAWSYEVADTKLALHTKPYFILQLCFYSEQLALVQGTQPERMHVVLGDGTQESFRVEDFRAYYARLKARFVAERSAGTYPLKVGHCAICEWDGRCSKQREDDDHLSLVARIRRDQIKKLQSAGIGSMADLATAPPEKRPPTLSEPTFTVLQRQARLQHSQRSDGAYRYELLATEPQEGFGLLPKPARGDVFFDMEGDPLYLPGRGLEYLFGVYAPDDSEPFRSFWAHSPAEEKRALEAFVDYLAERRKRYPEMHVYHYAPYEKTALRRLAGIHATRQEEIDAFLRAEIFVDLYAVVRQGLCISQPSYSIKKLEPFYGLERDTETKLGGDSIVMYELWRRDPQRSELLADIERYNQDDCRSTWMLREWLLELRAQAERAAGPIPWHESRNGRPCHTEYTAGCKDCERARRALEADGSREALRRTLLSGLDDVDAFTIRERPDEERLRWIIAHLLDYHRREKRPVWWAYFDRLENGDDFVDGDAEALGGLTLIDEVQPEESGRSVIYTYAFPPQQYKLGNTVCESQAGKTVTVESIDDERGIARIKVSKGSGAPLPLRALIPGGPLATDAQEASLARIAQACADGTLERHRNAVADLLLRRYPKLHGYAWGDVIQPPSVDEASLTRLASALDGSYLFIQGPPGSGKSTKAAAVIADLLAAGKRVGITSNSHAAIGNLLHKVEQTASTHGRRFAGLKKFTGEDQQYVSTLPEPMVQNTKDNAAFERPGWDLAAGTSWLFSREQMTGALDYLFIDEAGQVSLADALAMAPCATNLVLLGDPSQLAQVAQGVHPHGAGLSTLEHLLDGATTVPPDRGVFLDVSYRMHPEICAFISRNVYDGRLHSAPKTAQQAVESRGALSGSGLRFLGVEHSGNGQQSIEEAQCIAAEVKGLLLGTWTDAEGHTRLMTPDDILVVTPYNVQRRLIQREFAKRNIAVRVGTVDKFQGQEAAVVFFSMATSSSDQLPRDVEFLFSRNRFNVAISRARCLAVLVASLKLFDLRCTTVEQMRLANLLCSFEAAASGHTPAPRAEPGQLALFS